MMALLPADRTIALICFDGLPAYYCHTRMQRHCAMLLELLPLIHGDAMLMLPPPDARLPPPPSRCRRRFTPILMPACHAADTPRLFRDGRLMPPFADASLPLADFFSLRQRVCRYSALGHCAIEMAY